MSFLRTLTLGYRANAIGLLAGVMLIYVALSGRPWWAIVGGAVEEPTFAAEVSPFRVSILILGKPVEVAILPYLNLAATLTFLLASARVIAGSLLLRKGWSKPLVPLTGLVMPIVFVPILWLGLRASEAYLRVVIPLIGEFNLLFSLAYDGEVVRVHVPSRAILTHEYYVALAVGALLLAAKVVQNATAGKRPGPSGAWRATLPRNERRDVYRWRLSLPS